VMSGSSVSSTPSIAGSNGRSAQTSQSIATVTVNHGTTVVIISFVPSDPTITISSTDSTSSASIPTTIATTTDGALTSNQSEGSSAASQATSISEERSPSFWDSTGKVAGVFVAVGVIIALLAFLLLSMCRGRKGRKDEEKTEMSPSPGSCQMSASQPVSRSASLLQLLGKRDKSRQEDATPPSPTDNHRLSRTATELVIPVVDQRLDPQTMMIRFEDNVSRTSFRDEEDYSRRVWRVTNASDTDSVRSADISANT